MLVVLLPIAVALVGACAYLVANMAAPTTRVGRWLALWIAAWAEVVLTVEVLSLLGAVSPLGFIACYVVFGAVAALIWLKRGRPRVRLLALAWRPKIVRSHGEKRTRRERPIVPVRGPLRGAFVAHPALGVLLLVLVFCALVNVVLAVALPVNNYDANTYHLSRVGYWIQHGSTDHYFTHNERQNFMPPNAEYGFLSLMVFARAEWPAPLVQLAAYFVCIAAVFAIGRELGATNAAALFAALLLGTMTEIVLQATVPKNDLIVSSFLVCAITFALVGLGRRDATTRERARALVWSGLAVGLAFGTKATALLFLPGLTLAGIAVAMSGSVRDGTRRLALWATCCVGGVVLLGSLNYVRNWSSYDSPAGPRSFSDATRIAHPSLRGTASNLARYGYCLCDFSGLWPRPAAHLLTDAKARAAPGVFDVLGIAANAPDLDLGSAQGAFIVDAETGSFDNALHLHEDVAWFGPVEFFVGLPVVLALLVCAPVRGRWLWFAVALMPTAYWLILCVLLRYSIWNGRYFITAAVVGAPVLALAYGPWGRRGAGARTSGIVLTWLLVAAGTSTALTATLFNAAKPVVPRPVSEAAVSEELKRSRSVFTLPRLLVRCRYNPKEVGPILSVPSDRLPEEMRLGVVLGSDDWDWPLFGPHMGRHIVPLPPDAERVARAFELGEVDMVAILRRAAPLEKMGPMIGEQPLFILPEKGTDPLIAELVLNLPQEWSFLVRTQKPDTIFYPTRDWAVLRERPWIDADQQFVPTQRTGRGEVEFLFEPNEKILRASPLLFEFIGQGRVIRQIEVRQPGTRRLVLDWRPGATTSEQILRVRVHSPVDEIDDAVQRVADVYELAGGITFQPAVSVTPQP